MRSLDGLARKWMMRERETMFRRLANIKLPLGKALGRHFGKTCETNSRPVDVEPNGRPCWSSHWSSSAMPSTT